MLFTQTNRVMLPVGFPMKEKTDVLQGTLALMVLKTLDVLGPLHGYGIARRIEQICGEIAATLRAAAAIVASRPRRRRALAPGDRGPHCAAGGGLRERRPDAGGGPPPGASEVWRDRIHEGRLSRPKRPAAARCTPT